MGHSVFCFVLLTITFFFFNIYSFGCTGSQLQHVASSSLTRDQIWVPCFQNTESQPLDHQGSPGRSVFDRLLEASVTQGSRGHLQGLCGAQAGFCCVSKESTVLIARGSGVCLLGLAQQSEFKGQNYGLTVLGVGRPRSRCQHNQQGRFLPRP